MITPDDKATAARVLADVFAKFDAENALAAAPQPGERVTDGKRTGTVRALSLDWKGRVKARVRWEGYRRIGGGTGFHTWVQASTLRVVEAAR